MAEADIADFEPVENSTAVDQGLLAQDLSKLDVDAITPITPEVMSRQATINVGTIGHVAHGKSTVVKALTGVKTQKHQREAVLNITIHIGYANAKVFQCKTCPRPGCFHSFASSQAEDTPCPTCGEAMTLLRHFSFVDCPGHDVLMATMLNGAAIMDAALLLIAANETFPQSQTLEHMRAVEIMRMRNLVVLQNKIDLVSEVSAQDQYVQIRDRMTSMALAVPIIPISAQQGRNMDYLLEYLVHLPLPIRQLRCPSRLTVVRSFDINRPGASEIDTLKGGVAGGTVIQGIIKLDQVVEIRPGRHMTRSFAAPGESRFTYRPLRTRIASLMAENNVLQYAVPGGLIAVGTTLDPTLTRQNKMVGNIIGDEGTLPDVYCEMELQYTLYDEMVGSKESSRDGKKAASKRVQKLNQDELLQINIGSLNTGATVVNLLKTRDRADVVKLALESPVCCSPGEHVAISRRVEGSFRLIGRGEIRRGVAMEQSP